MGDWQGCYAEGFTKRCKENDWALLRVDAYYHPDWVVRVFPFSYADHYRKAPKLRESNGRYYGAFYLAGYPADKATTVVDKGTWSYRILEFWVDHQCQIRDVVGMNLLHDCDGRNGTSGAALSFRYNDETGERLSGLFGIASFVGKETHCPAYNKQNCYGAALKSQAFIPAIKRHVRPEYTRHLR
jgi:hypothetical protein